MFWNHVFVESARFAGLLLQGLRFERMIGLQTLRSGPRGDRVPLTLAEVELYFRF